jgi:lambda repressor-like predicted transcriptional regulator
MNWDKFFNSPHLIESAKRRLSERVVRSGDCMLWQGCRGSRGYGLMAVGKYNREATHRVAWAIANNKRPPAGMHVMHSCDTPQCVNPAHLSIGTAKDNQRDSVNKGRKNSLKGSANKWAKTTEDALITAAALFANGHTYRSISARLGISRAALVKTLQGHRWPHIQPVLRAILGREQGRIAA